MYRCPPPSEGSGQGETSVHSLTAMCYGAKGIQFSISQVNWPYWILLLFLQECQFTKIRDDTALRVVYQSNFRLYCNQCSKRWFITFNGNECRSPLPIEAVMWIRSSSQDNHLPGAKEGYCINISKGKIRVGINIGNLGKANSNGETGWGTVSRLIIEEIPRSQWKRFDINQAWRFSVVH